MQKFIRYVVFKPNTGEVIRYGVCEENALPNQANEGEDVIVGEFCGSQYVEDGALVNMPECPTQHHTFDYTTKQWVDPRTEQTQWPVVRSQRNALLSASDWTQLPDVPLATKETWAIYRQALRDITEQTDPFNINWPVRPDRQS